MKIILDDLDGAIKDICNGENEHPNRIDVCKASTRPQSATDQPAFGKPSNTSTFGQPSSTPAFGQPSRPSAFDQSSNSAFGQPSNTPAFGQPSGPSTFGQPSSSAFGKPSSTPAFGQPSGPSTFGRPSTSTFGQPSAPVSTFSQVTKPAPDRFPSGAFGQPSAPSPAIGQTVPSAFGQPATFGRPSTSFGQVSSTFGQPSVQAPVFGQPSSQSNQFANNTGGTSTFGQPSTQATAFGQPSAPSSFAGAQQPRAFALFGSTSGQPKGSAFPASSTSSFGQPTAAATAGPLSLQTSAAPFSGAAATTSTGGIFGRPSTISQTPFTQSPAQQQPNDGLTRASNTATDSALSSNSVTARRSSIHLPDNNVATRDARGNLKTWKNKEVRQIEDKWYYRDTRSSDWQRIWFPNGPPTFTKTEEISESAYDAAAKEKYLFAIKNGKFGEGGIPLMPPRKEWCDWNV